MNLQAKEEKKLGLYVHVPFCASTCDFCAFYQEKPKRVDLDRYIDGIITEINEQWPEGMQVDTIFWGGGTPGLLPAKDIAKIGEAIINKIGNLPAEWSIEMAPSTVKQDKLLAMKEMGVTRISMGVQTFNEDLLKELGRLHSPKQVYHAYDLIRECGINSVNLDLIFAIPRQTEANIEADMEEIRRLNPEHVSTYCLTFEEDTALFARLSRGEIKIDEERDRSLYLKMWDLLEEAGYSQYEVSNFCKPGHECVHNINTWKMRDWIGIGPSASSQYNRKRYTNIHSLDQWLEGVESGKMNRIDVEDIDDLTLAKDKVIFGLRMNSGINMKTIKDAGVERLIKNLLTEEYAWENEGIIGLTKEGRLLVDRIGTEVLQS